MKDELGRKRSRIIYLGSYFLFLFTSSFIPHPSSFQYDLCHRNITGVCEREVGFSSAYLAHALKGTPVQLNRRRACPCAHHLYIAPADSFTPSSAERFHRGFLCGEAGGVTFQPGRATFAVINLGFGEDTIAKSLAAPREDLFHTRYLDYINANRYYHHRAISSR
jgi:hypothetical protein